MGKFLLKYFHYLRTFIVVLIGVLISVFLIFIISKTPGASLREFFLGPFGSAGRFSNIFETATPMIFTGVAIAVVFQASQFNVGAEGALYLGAVAGTTFAVSQNLPGFIALPVTFVIAIAAGLLWGFIPGIIKAKWNANELVSTLMLNYVAYFLGLYLINYYFRDKNAGYLASKVLPESAWLPQIFTGTRFHTGIILAFATAVGVYILLYRTTLGYEIRITGENINYARYAGINVVKIIILSQVISGGLAAMGGITEVMGISRRFNWQASPGYGWDGVIVAIIGRNHPLKIIAAALFLAYLRVGGQILNLMTDVPAEMVSVIQSVIILLITAEAFLSTWNFRLTKKFAELELRAK